MRSRPIDSGSAHGAEPSTGHRRSQAETEIFEQPEVVARVLADRDGAIAAAAEAIRKADPRFAVIAARGTSDNAARYAQHVLGRLYGLPVALAAPSLHTIYGAHVRYAGGVVLGISQSGASPDVVAVLAAAKEQRCVTVALTNDPESPLAQAATHVVPLQAGVEASVAATKTYTASLAAVAALASRLGGVYAKDLAGVPASLERQLARTDGLQETIAATRGWERLAVIGRGPNYATAFEAALKIKELTGIVAEPASPADFLHGPVAVLEPGFPVIALYPEADAMRDVLATAREREADVTVIGEHGDGRLLAVEPGPEWLSPIRAVIPAQRLAVGAAELRGLDVDRPVGLTKVTRTT